MSDLTPVKDTKANKLITYAPKKQKPTLDGGRQMGYAFTVNNPTDDMIQSFNDQFITEKKIKYGCFSIEVGDSGTKHMQGYFYSQRDISFKVALEKMQSIFNTCVHLEKAFSDAGSNIAYCSGLCDKKNNELNPSFKEFGWRPMTQKEKGEAGNDIYPVDFAYIPILESPSAESLFVDRSALPEDFQSSTFNNQVEIPEEEQRLRQAFCNMVVIHNIPSADTIIHPFCDECQSYACSTCVQFCYCHSMFGDWEQLYEQISSNSFRTN